MNQKSNPTGSAEAVLSKKESLVDDAKQALGRVADQAKDQANMRVSSQKDRAVGTIDGVADAIRKTSHSLKDAGPIPDLADRAADGIEALASYVKNKNVGDLVGEVESFARREPALFLKSSTTAGTGGGTGRGGYDANERSYGRSYDGAFRDDDYGRDDYAGRSFGGVASASGYGSDKKGGSFGTTTAPMPATQGGTGTTSGLGGTKPTSSGIGASPSSPSTSSSTSGFGGSTTDSAKPGTGSSFGGGNTGSL